MMKVNVICVGGVKEKFFADACSEYAKRLSRFCELSLFEVNETASSDDAASVVSALKKDGEAALKKARRGGPVFVLAVEGKQMTSEDFSSLIAECRDKSGCVTFIIGGSNGLSAEVKATADRLIGFSEMTFPHTLMRVVLYEQIYRAFMIDSGSKYHK